MMMMINFSRLLLLTNRSIDRSREVMNNESTNKMRKTFSNFEEEEVFSRRRTEEIFVLERIITLINYRR